MFYQRQIVTSLVSSNCPTISSAVFDSDSTFSDLIVSRILARTETGTDVGAPKVPGIAFFRNFLKKSSTI